MVVARGSRLFKKDRLVRNLFSSPKRPVVAYSDTQKHSDKDLNDRIAERFLVKRTKRSRDLSIVSKPNSIASMVQSFKNASAKIDERMQLKGLNKNTNFFLGPKVPSSPEDRQVFATPKRYVCDCCNAKMFSVSAYMNHLRKHKVNIRCSGCNRIFDHIVSKRCHELHCPKKTKLRF